MPKKQTIQVEGRELAISNTEKVYYPESGFTKGEVIAFYAEIADVILPHLRDRPLTLKRYPEGIAGEHFYEKNAPSHTPGWVQRFAVPRSEGDSAINYILCNDRATLVWATNLGDIEKHVLLARAPHLDWPTALVFDLDPGDGVGILDCGRVALHLKGLFETWGLQSFVKVSGSKGLHLSVPLNGEIVYEVAQPFARTVAELATQQLPKGVVSDMAKTLRRGKVLIDWSQNSDFKTTVCVYSMRAKHGQPYISLPVGWDELARAIKRGDDQALAFTAVQAVKRIKKIGDLFAPVLTLQQALPAAFTQALAAGPAPKLSSWPRNAKKGGDKSVREYAAKRDHTQTPEPVAEPVAPGATRTGVHRFVIQKHQASHLHYDWRLEMQGVLRSWAVPKGPPTELRESRLAMHVEDHPLAYENFEGTIPPGNYGAGTVMVWDRGEYEDLTGNPTAAFYAGKLHLIMRGTKLNGEWIMVKDRRAEDNRWLLIKAGASLPPFPPEVDDRSVISGRSLAEIGAANDAQWQSSRAPAAAPRRRPHSARVEPAYLEPMQCQPVTALPEDEHWTFELKFDGYRCIAVKRNGDVTLFSRNRKNLSAHYPNVIAALRAVPGDFVLDGEVVALDAQGRPSFQLLQNAPPGGIDAYLYAFDLLNVDGAALQAQALEQRRERLGVLLAGANGALRVSPVLLSSARNVLEAVQKLGLEGVIGKRRGSVYEPGLRSGSWIKHRTNREQEFVIGGYVPGRRGFDSLLVGVYDEKRQLVFAAKVKNGFVPQNRDDILPRLKKLTVPKCPFGNLPEKKGARWGEPLTAEKMQECVWVKPQLVCQVAFVEWTDAGHLRHCTYLAMRADKLPREVVRET